MEKENVVDVLLGLCSYNNKFSKIIYVADLLKTGSLSTRVFETRTATGREHSVCQDSGVSHIFILIVHNREKVLSIVYVMCEDEL